jgi:hypothetical protein
MIVVANMVGLSQLRVDIVYSIDPMPPLLSKRYRSIYYPRADMAGTPNLEGCEARCRYDGCSVQFTSTQNGATAHPYAAGASRTDPVKELVEVCCGAGFQRREQRRR